MLLPNKEQFSYKDVVIAGDDCWLITPDSIKCKWTEDNLKYRSMIVRKSDNFIVSRSFPKFFNFSEQPDLDKFPLDEPFVAYEKLDGSLAIFDIYKGQLIARTRGTCDLRQLPNGHELDFLLEKYSTFFEYVKIFDDKTFLCEWQTNSNVIVIGGFPEPKLSLLGIIDKITGELVTQKILDIVASCLNISRPEKYEYNSIQECISDTEQWTDREGVVIYSESGKMRKIKSNWYLTAHRIATGLRSLSNVLDFFLESPKFVDYKDFYDYTTKIIDYEVAERIKDEMLQITEAYGKFIHTVQTLEQNIPDIRLMDTRKEQAQFIQSQFEGWVISLAFNMLDNKEIDDKMIKKAMQNILKL